jgi:thioredoxin-like negative regulator of GroEL
MNAVGISSPEEMASFVRSAPVVAVHFWAVWSRYDDEMRRRLERIHPFGASVRLATVNIDDEWAWGIARNLKVLNLPAIAYFRDGERAFTELGLRSSEHVEARLGHLLELAG